MGSQPNVTLTGLSLSLELVVLKQGVAHLDI